jgi:hypothetical protein
MESFGQNRYVPLVVAAILAIGLGAILLYSLDVATYEDDFDSYSISYSDAQTVMDLSGDGWVRNISLIGMVGAIVSALAFTRRQASLQAIAITICSIAAMAGPIWIATKLEDGEKVGPGLISSIVCFGIAAIVPWVFMVLDRPKASPQFQS